MRQVTVITGGAGGMGFATANVLGCKGDSLLLCDVREDALESATQTLTRQNMDVSYMVVDVSDQAQVQAAAEKASSMGEVCKLIHTAGLSPVLVGDLPDEEGAKKIMNVNAMGTINMIEAFYPILANNSVVICFSSSTVYMMPQIPEDVAAVYDSICVDRENIHDKLQSLTGGQPGRAYMFSKLFVKRYCEMNVGRLGRKGSRIVTIAPGRILTHMHQALLDVEPERLAPEIASMPMGRYGNAYEIANLVDFLCSYKASYISGIDILMDDGTQAFTTAPQLAD